MCINMLSIEEDQGSHFPFCHVCIHVCVCMFVCVCVCCLFDVIHKCRHAVQPLAQVVGSILNVKFYALIHIHMSCFVRTNI
jgi:hypothetical protein